MSENNEALASALEYVDARAQGVEMAFDEASGPVLVNAGSHGWVTMATAGSTPPISGDLSTTGAIHAVSPLSWGDPKYGDGPDYAEVMSALASLVNTVERGACCRCAPTEVCPECHDLNIAMTAAQTVLKGFVDAQPSNIKHEARESRWNVSSGSASYSGSISAGTLTVSDSGAITYKAGT